MLLTGLARNNFPCRLEKTNPFAPLVLRVQGRHRLARTLRETVEKGPEDRPPLLGVRVFFYRKTTRTRHSFMLMFLSTAG